MEQTSAWDVGTLVWVAFGMLLVYTLLANLAELVVDAVADRRDRRGSAMSAGDEDDLLGWDDDFSWADAFSSSYDEPSEDPEPPVFAGGACRTCGLALVPVVYGYPGPELVQAARDGRVLLGGCTVGDERAACPRCGGRF